MVYCGRPSRGCKPCRSRRVKCDQEVPLCGQCLRAGRRCTGYRSDHDLFFRDESERVSVKCKQLEDAKEKRWRAEDERLLQYSNEIGPVSNLPPNHRSCEQQQQQQHHIFLITERQQSKRLKDMIPNAVSSDAKTLLARNLVTQLHSANDLRWSVTWVWGPHMVDIPSRLGTSAVLDAAVNTMLLVNHDCRTFMSQLDEGVVLRAYQKAVRSMGVRLQDPAAKDDAQTLCAVMMLSACSPRFDGPIMVFGNAHARGAAEILRLRGFPAGRDSFESMLFAIVRGSVAFRAIADSGIHFSDKEWKAFEDSFQGDHPTTRLMRCAVQIGRMMAHARTTVVGSYEERVVYLWATELQSKLDAVTLELQYELYSKPVSDSELVASDIAHAQNLRNFSTALAISAQLLCMRRAFSPTNDDLADDIQTLWSRMLQLTEDAKIYQPLGSNWIVITLMAVWCAVNGTPLQLVVEEVLDGWQMDIMGDERAVIPPEVLLDLHKRLVLGRVRSLPKIRRTKSTQTGTPKWFSSIAPKAAPLVPNS